MSGVRRPTISEVEAVLRRLDRACQISSTVGTGRDEPPSFAIIVKEIMRMLQNATSSQSACPKLDRRQHIGPEKLVDIRTRFLLWIGEVDAIRPHVLPNVSEVTSRVRDILVELKDLLRQSIPPPCKQLPTGYAAH